MSAAILGPAHAIGAVISDCGRYRYLLWRSWGEAAGPRAVFLMLNPSTADACTDDPTIRKCMGFARRWGMHGISIVNLFAYRSTDPKALAELAMIVAVGERNSEYVNAVDLLANAGGGGRIVCAWGSCGNAAVKKKVRERLVVVKRQLREVRAISCLGRSADGNPRHPLMLSYSTPLEPWSVP